MALFEIDLNTGEAQMFDEAFWRFVQSELVGSPDPDVQMDAMSIGAKERRVIKFGCGYQAEAFARHWGVAHR